MKVFDWKMGDGKEYQTWKSKTSTQGKLKGLFSPATFYQTGIFTKWKTSTYFSTKHPLIRQVQL